ncbi:16S rRNA (cytosine(967)-C(5))-methyltransferase RsmB [Salinibacillus xinjiangensis]|uniref:16S rRNA (cytosine(967)-C(5))-methyltransferase n=1 Tax=Salinibacillus xinjiangensis TaxID=1229268 RepID=A0A6G1X3J3_9BACI|nr:16S rRNA (cytosine(967)-C(5))-methyltransferase RsmB [Salinibacillus xinjiangensis]MRG85450.1 16S rRNA (cytosine(967)-C(5))-methyltransferase RsmB [Salinibacillus xinjiangensis]
MAQKTVREAALNILLRVGQGGGYSHLLIQQEIDKDDLNRKDVGLLTELVYGTLQRRDTLAFYLAPFVRKRVKPWVRWLLYLAIYQMEYLEKVPDHAIIYESVEMAKKKGGKGVGSFVNGVLRNIQRSGVPSLESIEDPVERLAIETSHPKWLVERFVKWYGFDVARSMCYRNLHAKPTSVRVQSLNITRDKAMERLQHDGFELEPSSLSPQGIIVKSGNIFRHPLFKESFTVQDESSMLVGEMMDVKPGMFVLDACSAPGGKTTHIAEKMKNEGKIHAYDLHVKKAKLVEEKAKDLGLTNIEAKQGDSRNLDQFYDTNFFDRILLDAPCSGLGVLRGKPDIKYQKSAEDIHNLASIQKELLESVSPLLKTNGKLVYSTCTVDKEENEHLIKAFLLKHDEFTVDPTFMDELPEVVKTLPGLSEWGLQLFPQDLNTDGFFLTRLVKRK